MMSEEAALKLAHQFVGTWHEGKRCDEESCTLDGENFIPSHWREVLAGHDSGGWPYYRAEHTDDRALPVPPATPEFKWRLIEKLVQTGCKVSADPVDQIWEISGPGFADDDCWNDGFGPDIITAAADWLLGRQGKP